MTTSQRLTPFRIPVHFANKDGLVALEQVRTVDRDRLLKRLGHVDDATLSEVLRVMAEMFAQ